MGTPQWACVSAQIGEAIEQGLIGRAREKRREQRIFPRARRIDLIDLIVIDVTGIHVTGRISHPVCSLAESSTDQCSLAPQIWRMNE
jgi:hypothetical protein